ncbi:MAG: InlB B-repeat-containing protein [Lachnospiraceae bacterium]|nr:InlB B-repeat-containing protein [Lachnospiraceae bacterium]
MGANDWPVPVLTRSSEDYGRAVFSRWRKQSGATVTSGTKLNDGDVIYAEWRQVIDDDPSDGAGIAIDEKSLGGNGTGTFGTGPYTLKLRGSYKYPDGVITWKSSDPEIVSIKGDQATIHKPGEVTITAVRGLKPADNYDALIPNVLETGAVENPWSYATDALKFEILKGENSITIDTSNWPTVKSLDGSRNRFELKLSDPGKGSGAVTWSSDDLNDINIVQEGGKWYGEILDSGAYAKITATKAADDNWSSCTAEAICEITHAESRVELINASSEDGKTEYIGGTKKVITGLGDGDIIRLEANASGSAGAGQLTGWRINGYDSTKDFKLLTEDHKDTGLGPDKAGADPVVCLWIGNGEVQVEAVYETISEKHSVTVSADPAGAGSVTGSGTYKAGDSVTVRAVAADGYTFKRWTENGSEVSTDATYTFPMGTADKNLTAVFDAGTSVTPETSHTLTVTAREGGTASGGGTYAKDNGNNPQVTVTARPDAGRVFDGWYDAAGTRVSTDQNYTFELKGDLTLEAWFRQYVIPPEAITGLVYNGTAHDLVTPARAGGRTVQYKLSTEGESAWRDSVPQGTDAGNYIVQYRVSGTYENGDVAVGIAKSKIKPSVSLPLYQNSVLYTNWIGKQTYRTPQVSGNDGVTPVFSWRDNGTSGAYTSQVPENAGTYTLHAYFPPSKNYAAAEAMYHFEITKNEWTLTTIGLQVPGISYGQKLSDSAISCDPQYGTVAWKDPDTVPAPGNGSGPYKLVFTPTAEFARNNVVTEDETKINVGRATPAVSLSVSKDASGQTATITATVFKASSGATPGGSCTLSYSDDSGSTWNTISSTNVTTGADAAGNLTLTLSGWDYHSLLWNASSGTYKECQIKAHYNGDGSAYNAADSPTITFNPAANTSPQQPLTLTPSAYNPVYGDSISFTAAGGSGTGALSYESADSTVLRVDATTGAATILKAGSATVTVTKAGDNDYSEAKTSITVTIGKRPLRFTAEDKTITQGDALPAWTYTVDGLAGTDSIEAGKEPALRAVRADGTTELTNADTNVPRRYDILISGGTVTLGGGNTAAWADCYAPEYANGTLIITPSGTVVTHTVAVSTNPAGSGTVTGGGVYHHGDTATVQATANAGYKFKQWKEGTTVVSTNATYSFKVDADRTLVAEFDLAQQPTPTETFTVNVEVASGSKNRGTVTGGGIYKKGEKVTIQANAGKYYDVEGGEFRDYAFHHWEDGSGKTKTMDASFEHIVDGNVTFVAFFGPPVVSNVTQYTYTRIMTVGVASGQAGWGTVTGGGVYSQDTTATVTATANPGYRFVRWTEDGTEVSRNASYSASFAVSEGYVPVYKDRTLIAEFEPLMPSTPTQYTISVGADPAEGGTVTGGGIYIKDAFVTVKAVPFSNYDFAGWYDGTGNRVSTDASYTFAANADRTLTAAFNRNTAPPVSGPHTVTVSANPTVGGTVTGGGTYDHGHTASVTATANAGYTFKQWTRNGTVVGTNTTYSFTVDADTALVAEFEIETTPAPSKYIILVSADPSQGGTVSGGGTYNEGDSVTVTASANTGYKFTGWRESGKEVSTDAAYTFTANATRNLTAVFIPDGTTPPAGPQKQYSVTVTSSQGGTVTGGGTYKDGEIITLTATPDAGYSFVHFALANDPAKSVSTANPYSFTAAENVTLVAVFAPDSLYYTSGMNGNWQQGSSSPLPFTTNGTYELFSHITVDGKVVAAKDYEAESGSTIIRLKAAFLATLSAGTHTLETFYTNGTSIATQFTITASGTNPANPANPTNPSNPSNLSNPAQPSNPGGGGSGGGSTPSPQATGGEGQNAAGGTDTVATRTNVSAARSASGAQNTNARGGQTGDDMYERLGLHTLVLLAALLLLIAQLRKLMEENMLLAISASCSVRKIPDSGSGNQKRKNRVKRTESGLEFIEMNTVPKSKPRAKRCVRNKGFTKGNR